MISEQMKFLFIHVPKTAGNSIQSLLINYSEDKLVAAGTKDGVERFGIVNDTYSTTKHSTLLHYRTQLPEDLYQQLFKFSVMRNPFDRLVSLYFSKHRGRRVWNRGQVFTAGR